MENKIIQSLTDEQFALSLAVKSTDYNTVRAITERASEFLKWLQENKEKNGK
jgi:hypothetical protein